MKRTPGERLKHLLNLIRLPNLLIVALTMILIRYAIIGPLLGSITVSMTGEPDITTPMRLQLPWTDFVILVLSVCLITAAGYVINDYFDIRADLINKGRIIVGDTINRRTAMMYHNILNLLGVAGGVWVSARIGFIWLGVIFLLTSGLLWFYSAVYKRQLLIGNIIVALLVAMVPLMVVIYDAAPVHNYYSASAAGYPGVGILFWWVGGFALFAFMTTLIREIIKDMEDCEGDRETGRKTLPVISGLLMCRVVVSLLTAVTIGLLYYVWYNYLSDLITLLYITLLLALPMVFVTVRAFTASERRGLHLASSLMKLVMLAGILYTLVAGAIISSGKIGWHVF